MSGHFSLFGGSDVTVSKVAFVDMNGAVLIDTDLGRKYEYRSGSRRPEKSRPGFHVQFQLFVLKILPCGQR